MILTVRYNDNDVLARLNLRGYATSTTAIDGRVYEGMLLRQAGATRRGDTRKNTFDGKFNWPSNLAMTGRIEILMVPLEKRNNRANKTALLNLSFSRRFALPLQSSLVWTGLKRIVSNSITRQSDSQKKPCIMGLRVWPRHSHSIVPVGFGVRSNSTRLTPGTSAVMRAVMCWSRAKGTSSTVAVMASRVLTARIMTGHS